jgi:flagellar hook-basal body complex protein FliE
MKSGGETGSAESVSRGETSFSDALKDSIGKVNDIQHQADQAVQDLTAGKSNNLHQTMIAMEKASVSFELMMQVRNKILSAYEEIMRMQV